MRPGHNHTQRQETTVTLRVDPRVVLSSQILQLNQQELEQAIETELNENPALERLEESSEPVTDNDILRAVAPHELRPSSEDFEFKRSLPVEEEYDWVDFASSNTTLWEHLRAQLLPAVPKRLQFLAQYMIEGIDERGYLTLTIEEAALATDTSLEDAELVLAKLQECEPAGVGATNLQECLLLQLRNPETLEQKLARAILKSHMDDFIARRTMKIMRRFKVMPDVVEAAFQEILTLSPYPGEGFASAHWNHASASRATGVAPDLTLSRDETGWQIEVKGADASALAVSRAYRRRLQQLGQMDRAPKDEKRHVSTYVQRANDFIECLRQRRRTLRRIGEYLVQHQGSFVSTGRYEFLQPLTRSKMANELGLHESTVSRATMDKFVQLASGEIVSFEVFFKPALRVQKMIEEILQHENPDNPLSDERIAELLAKKGVLVARRTVNKYRDRTKLLSSRKRKSA